MRRLLLIAVCCLLAQGAWAASKPEGLSQTNPVGALTMFTKFHSLFVGTIRIPALAASGGVSECTNGNYNVGIGELAGSSLTAGCVNTFVGYHSGMTMTTSSLNTALGMNTLALENTTSGEGENTAIGYGVLSNLLGTTCDAGPTNCQGRYNTAVGSVCMQWFQNAQFNVCMGSHAMIAVGATSGLAKANVAIGYDALPVDLAPSQNTCVGAISCFSQLAASGADNTTAVGWSAARNNVSGEGVVAIGASAFYFNTAPVEGVAIGWQAGLGGGSYATTGSTLVGFFAGRAQLTGADYNTLVGDSVGQSTTTGSENVAIGSNTLYQNTTGSQNVAVGRQSMLGAAVTPYAVSKNAALGYNALKNVQTGADGNIGVGYQAGAGITTGANNIFLGYSTTSASVNQVTTGSRNISIGYDIAIPTATSNNQLNIGNFIFCTGLDGTGTTISAASCGFGIKAPAKTLDVTGTFNVSGASTLASIAGTTLDLSAAAPTVAAAHIGYGSTTAAAANCNSSAAISPTACIVVNVAGTTRYIPYF